MRLKKNIGMLHGPRRQVISLMADCLSLAGNLSLSGVVRSGGELWVDFLIFRGFGYYLMFWFYFMNVD
jgi:hypothetical protein